MSVTQILLLALVGVVYGVVYLIKKRYALWKNMGVPYLEPSIPSGNLKGIGTKYHFGEFSRSIYQTMKERGPFTGIFFFIRPVAVITDLDLVKHVLVKDFQYFQNRGIFTNEEDDPLSAHLFSLEGDRWRDLRAKLSPTFTSGKMKTMYPIIVDISEKFKQKLNGLINEGVPVDIKNINGRFTMDVIGNCAFGIECNSLFGENHEFYEMGLKTFKETRHKPAVLAMMASFKTIARKFHMKFNRDDVEKFFLGVVRDTIDLRHSQNIKRNDFMDILINLMKKEFKNDGLTFNEVAAQAFIFFLAGFETSSTLMSFCMFELSQNLEIQEKLRQHINDVLEKHDGQFTYEAMLEMKYLEQVLNETLRKYPPVPNLIRTPSTDYKVPNTNFVIPKNGMILIPVYGIHYDEEIYPDPDSFNPDRFEEEEVHKRSSVSFLPFGDGPRNCIGLRFGLMQARVGMVTVLRNFSFELSQKTKAKLPMQISKHEPVLGFSEKVYMDFKRVK